VFLDRDGTLIHDKHYLRDPERVRLLPGAVDALRALTAAGYALIVITNQSGIARGLLTEQDYEAVRERLDALLGEQGVALTASYHCPHHPDVDGPCECRKPGTLLFERAVKDHALRAEHSVAIGDRWRDLAPAITLGARGVLVPSPDTPTADFERARAEAMVASDLRAAAALVVDRPAG
jgi:histidinol-phosphate phosphatase family protein